ncbi:MAG: S41 family peptidase [Candidatus Saccharimonadales bacterium]
MGLKSKHGVVHTHVKKKSHTRDYIRTAIVTALVFGVFILGIFIGDGRLGVQAPWDASRYKTLSNGLPDNLDYSSVNLVYQSLKANYDGKLTETQILDGLKHGLANAPGDPYTTYFTPTESKNFNNELNNSFSGIGAELTQDSNGDIQIIAPIAGSPAAAAGLQAQDIIAGIDGTSTSGFTTEQAVNKIRGKAGTKVTLQVVRNKSKVITLTITRQNITAPSVTTKTLANNIGYINISTFADDTSNLAQKAAQQFASSHVKGIILDLRDDPGGLLNAAVDVSSLWLPQNQTILVEKHGSEVVQSYFASGNDILHGIPTVILVNGGSASASEITTGALHDNNAAYVIGTKSFGKGVVQQLIPFGDGSQLKVTVASWYRPNGQNINHRGITPDKKVDDSGTNLQAPTDSQLVAAEAYLNK